MIYFSFFTLKVTSDIPKFVFLNFEVLLEIISSLCRKEKKRILDIVVVFWQCLDITLYVTIFLTIS